MPFTRLFLTTDSCNRQRFLISEIVRFIRVITRKLTRGRHSVPSLSRYNHLGFCKINSRYNRARKLCSIALTRQIKIKCTSAPFKNLDDSHRFGRFHGWCWWKEDQTLTLRIPLKRNINRTLLSRISQHNSDNGNNEPKHLLQTSNLSYEPWSWLHPDNSNPTLHLNSLSRTG